MPAGASDGEDPGIARERIMGIAGMSRLTAIVVAGVAIAGSAVGPAGATPGDRTETVVRTGSPMTTVTESLVRVHIPLPEGIGDHPEACDWLSYLRYRDARGPERSADADRVLVAQPGILEGAGAFDSVARNTVAAAARRGKHIEFWALDRRSNCLDDHRGIRAGLAAHGIDAALGYYYHGESVDGQRFAGFLGNSRVGWLAHVGIEQTVNDEYQLLAHELPDPRARRRKVLCGGHSLGGIITGYFADWDFGGAPGYAQCSGYFALDSSIALSLSALSGMSAITAAISDHTGSAYAATQAALNSGVAPVSADLPVLISPETMTLLAIAGMAADIDPDGQSGLAAALPPTLNLQATLRFLFSRDAATFASGVPSVAQFRLTNAAVLGALLGNTSQPLAFLQSSPGFFDGGPVADKDFPLPHDLAHSPALKPLTATVVGPDALAIPAIPGGPLYRWRNFDRMDASIPADRTGRPYATPATEVTDIHELARSLAEQPLPFTDDYFPAKLATDVNMPDSPQIATHLRHPNGIAANPTLDLLGGSGLVVASGALPPGRVVIAPGYHHLDVLTAAAHQNDGRPEIISTALAEFAAP